MAEQQKEELKIKDLLIKLQVLTNGLIEERKKSQSYLDRIKEYEQSLQKKDAEIADLTREKFDLKSKLTLEKSKQAPNKKNDSYLSSFLNKFMEKPVDDSKVGKLEEKINQQKYEIKDLTQRLMEEKESFDQQKIKFQTMITLQNQQMAELKKNLENTKKEKEKEVPNEELILSHKEKIDSLNRKFNLEKDEYEKKLAEYRIELKDQKEKCENLEVALSKYKEAYDARTVENNAMKLQITSLDSQLNQAKVEIKNKQLAPRMFQVERIKDGLVKNKKTMTITFQWNKKKNVCEVIFRRMKKGGVKEDVVNIVDISQFKMNDKKKENVDIVFTVSVYYLINIYY
jgi:chromosome segregation ATPase